MVRCHDHLLRSLAHLSFLTRSSEDDRRELVTSEMQLLCGHGYAVLFVMNCSAMRLKPFELFDTLELEMGRGVRVCMYVCVCV